jgi:ADP-heptose:LPS heptosyltransferase
MVQLPPAMVASSLPLAPGAAPTSPLGGNKLVDPSSIAILIILGGYGDSMWSSPICRRLHEQGYTVWVYTTEWGVEVFRHNPYVSLIRAYDRPTLGQETFKIDFPEGARLIKCAGIIEKLLTKNACLKDRLAYKYGCDAHPEHFELGCGQCTARKFQRNVECNHNYTDTLFDNLGFPELKGSLPELYFTAEEGAWAAEKAKEWEGKFVICWSAVRTAYHKIYPYWFRVCEIFTQRHPEVVVFHAGPKEARATQAEGERIYPAEWNMRESMSLLPYMNMVVGGETGFLNAASACDVAKVIFHSHSTHEKLCKYWTNHICLQPWVPCAPCHQTHDPTEAPNSCPTAFVEVEKPEIKYPFPICMAYGLSLKRVLAAMEELYQKHYAQKVE